MVRMPRPCSRSLPPRSSSKPPSRERRNGSRRPWARSKSSGSRSPGRPDCFGREAFRIGRVYTKESLSTTYCQMRRTTTASQSSSLRGLFEIIQFLLSKDLDLTAPIIVADTIGGKRLRGNNPFVFVAKTSQGQTVMVRNMAYIKFAELPSVLSQR